MDGYSIDNTVEIAKKCKVVYEDRGRISYAKDIGVKQIDEINLEIGMSEKL